MFSLQVEAFMRYRALQTRENTSLSQKYKDSSNVCRFVRLYYSVLRSSGVTAECRMKVLGYLIVRINDMIKLEDFLPWEGEYVCGVARHTFEELCSHFFQIDISKLFNFSE